MRAGLEMLIVCYCSVRFWSSQLAADGGETLQPIAIAEDSGIVSAGESSKAQPSRGAEGR